jgi:hypothetical protein
MQGFQPAYPQPGTRDYMTCPLCGRSIEHHECQNLSQWNQAAGLTGQMPQSPPICKVCQSRSMQQMQSAPSQQGGPT